MRTVMIGLVVGSALGLFAGLATSRYVSVAPPTVEVHQNQASHADSRKWDI